LSYDDAKDWIWDNLPTYVPPPKPKIGAFEKFVMPVIREIAPVQPLLEELVQVQPMQVPAGNVFYLDFVYNDKWWKRWWKALVRVLKRCASRIHSMRRLPSPAADQAAADQRDGAPLDYRE